MNLGHPFSFPVQALWFLGNVFDYMCILGFEATGGKKGPTGFPLGLRNDKGMAYELE